MVLSLIKSLPFFAGLPHDALEIIAQNARCAEIAAGHKLLKAGGTPAYMMIILSGSARLNEQAEDGHVIDISFAGINDLLAWLSIIDGKPVNQTITAVTHCKLLILPIALMQNLVAKNALLASRFLQLSAQTIRRQSQARAMLSLPNAFHRVFVQINLLSSGANNAVTSLPKQQFIADSVNTSRETVSRALQMLIKNGVLHKVGHQIVIKRADTLKKLAIDGPDGMTSL